MADHVYINNYSNKGKLAISRNVFDSVVSNTLERLNVNKSRKQMKRNQRFRLNRPVQTTIRHGIVHVWVAVDIPKGENIQAISRKIEEEIADSFLAMTDQIPFDVQVKVETLIQ